MDKEDVDVWGLKKMGTYKAHSHQDDAVVQHSSIGRKVVLC